jgi:hypothetical protein
MQTSVACPKCGRSFQVPPELLNKRLRCLQCQHVFAAQAGPPLETALQSSPVLVCWPLDLPAEEEEPPPSRSDARIQRTNHGVPGYLWPFAALPWGLLLLALGGCIWGVLAGLAAAVLSAAGVALVQARQVPVGMRLAGLLALDGVAGLLAIVGGVLAVALSVSTGSGPAPGPTLGPAANQPIQAVGQPAPQQAAPAQPQGNAPALPPAADVPLPPAADVPLPPVRELFAQKPRVYLSDLPEFGAQAGPWPFGKNGRNGDGKPIRVNGTLSPKGLSMHPPWAPSFASVRYRLGKQVAQLRAMVAINETSNWCWSPATFTVLGDGKTLWQSVGIAHNHTHTQDCRVDVSGVDVLELRVQCVNGSNGVHAVWVEPRLLQKADTPDE